MNKFFRLFASPILAVVLLFTFGTSMAIATFIENDFGTSTAWKIIYDAWWFELVMLGLGICFIMNIFKYSLWRLEKWALLMFHLAFIIILLGASITRYASYGGIMRIREGKSSNMIISDNNYLHVHLSDGTTTKTIRKRLEFSPISNNDFELNDEFNGFRIFHGRLCLLLPDWRHSWDRFVVFAPYLRAGRAQGNITWVSSPRCHRQGIIHIYIYLYIRLTK